MQNYVAISHQVFPVSLLDISAGNCQKALVNESGMIRKKQLGTHSRSEMVALQVALYAHPTRLRIKAGIV
jgi:hypothetical protein